MKIIFLTERVLAILFWGLLIFGFDMPYIAVLTIISAVIHEGGHIIALLMLKKGRKAMPYGDITGLRIGIGMLSYKEEFICAVSGPLLNILLWILSLFWRSSDYIYTFGLLNLMSAVSNLLPIEEYDGYRALRAIFSMILSDATRVENILRAISFFFSVLMTFFSLFVMLKLGEGYWIFAVFASAMISRLVKKQKHTFCEKNRDFESF